MTQSITSLQNLSLQCIELSDENHEVSVELIRHPPSHDTTEQQRRPLHEGAEGVKDSSMSAVTDKIIFEARKTVESKRQINYKKTDERAQQIVQNAIKSSIRREAQLRSTREVVKVAEKDIPSDTEKILSELSKSTKNKSKSREAITKPVDEARKINEEIARRNKEILSRKSSQGSFAPTIFSTESFSTMSDSEKIEKREHQSESHSSPFPDRLTSTPSHVQISSPNIQRHRRRTSSASVDTAEKSILYEMTLPDSKPQKSIPRDTPPRMALGVSISDPKGQQRRRSSSGQSKKPTPKEKDPKKVKSKSSKSKTPPRDTPPRMSLGPSNFDAPNEQQCSSSSEKSKDPTTPQSMSRDTPSRLELNSATPKLSLSEKNSRDDELEFISPTYSYTSVDEYERAVGKLPAPSKFTSLNRENMLNLIDGIRNPKRIREFDEETADDDLTTVPDSPTAIETTEVYNTFASYLDYFLGKATGKTEENTNKGEDEVNKTSLQDFSPLACGDIQAVRDVVKGDDGKVNEAPTIRTKVIQRNHSFTETIQAKVVDPHMPSWISQLVKEEKVETEDLSEYFFVLGESRTIIVHEIMRGNWTWCTAWSPDGLRLAIATENHHLAVIDTSSSTVWRVKYDKRISIPTKNHTTHSIRSIAWGSQFIAIGGTGNAVSILSPIEPYPIIHTIKGTGFVGSLAWRLNSSILAVGSREDKCSLYFITAAADRTACTLQSVVSKEIYTVTRKDWVNAVSFSPDGSILAVGDRSGKLSVYSFEAIQRKSPTLEKISHFKFSASVLDLEWSPDGKLLYAGGEDFAMTVLDTTKWEVVHTMSRDRWIQFISSSHRGTHVAVGGGASEVTILDTMDNWKKTLSIELKGLVPLSAKWHPQDQFLALTGQDNSIIAIETTNARHIKGHYLQSISPVLQVEFSPNGQILAVGNEAGVVSFYRSDQSSFVTTYEIFLAHGASQSIVWSPNGSYVMVGSGNTLSIIGQANSVKNGEKLPPSSSGLGIRKVIRDLDTISTISIHGGSRFAALVGESISILDAANDFNCVKTLDDHEPMKASAWSLDGTWLATTGVKSGMVIFDTSDESVAAWHTVFTFDCEDAGNALAWGPSVVEGLQYLAFGGDNKKVTIIEIRTSDGTWETVLEVSRKGVIHDLDWSETGLLAAAVGDGTVTVIDLGYLKSGWAVNEMDYNWQRQGITCFTEIRRNQGVNSMRTIRWIPSKASEESLLAIGGSDGAFEVVDLTERSKCKGFGN
eukprot:CAMPEP_0194249820 /NCGR_PEP_ID=MMETSP0158-20130606/21449_1 /TAXON_ID=33649 /ORGANISM="Thalassionema nitzschioides, Strain L26-B" /LENGTH=1246 /DNA_ID=CAMNT_0038986433 /DNA_START=52 /DNA_END=3792 /DNA_ORIENTATION=-